MREIYDLSLHEVLHNGPISYIGGFTLIEVHKNITTNSTALTSCHFTPKSCEQPITHGPPQMHVMWVCKRTTGLGGYFTSQLPASANTSQRHYQAYGWLYNRRAPLLRLNTGRGAARCYGLTARASHTRLSYRGTNMDPLSLHLLVPHRVTQMAVAPLSTEDKEHPCL
jgi:hypothetical protein